MFFFNRNTIQHPGENIPYEEQVRKLKEKMQKQMKKKKYIPSKLLQGIKYIKNLQGKYLYFTKDCK